MCYFLRRIMGWGNVLPRRELHNLLCVKLSLQRLEQVSRAHIEALGSNYDRTFDSRAIKLSWDQVWTNISYAQTFEATAMANDLFCENYNICSGISDQDGTITQLRTYMLISMFSDKINTALNPQSLFLVLCRKLIVITVGERSHN